MRVYSHLYKILILYLVLSIRLIAVSLPDSLEAKISNLSDLEKAKYLGSLCWQNRAIDPNLSIMCGKAAIELAEQQELDNYFAQISNYLGVAYMAKGFKVKEALKHFHDALEIALKIRDSLQIGYAYNNLGDVYIYTRNLPLAEESSLKALDYFQSLKNERGMAYSYLNLGDIYRVQKKYDLSLMYLNKCYEIRVANEEKYNIGAVLFHLALTYYYMQNYYKSADHYEKTLEYYY